MSVTGATNFEGVSAGIIKPWDTLTPSSRYKFFLRGIQNPGSGAVVDESGQGNNASLGLQSDADAWGNAGYFSSSSGTGLSPKVANSVMDWDIATQSMIFAFRIKGAALPGNDSIVGKRLGGSHNGFRFNGNASGEIRIILGTGGATEAYTPQVVALDGTEHHVVAMVDGVSKEMFMYIDSVASGTGQDVSSITSTVFNNNIDCYFGSDDATTPSYDLQFSDVHHLVFDGALPINMQSVVNKLFTRKFHPLQDSDFVF